MKAPMFSFHAHQEIEGGAIVGRLPLPKDNATLLQIPKRNRKQWAQV